MIRRSAITTMIGSAIGAAWVATKRLFGVEPKPRAQTLINDRVVADRGVGDRGDNEPSVEMKVYPYLINGTTCIMFFDGFDFRKRFICDPSCHTNFIGDRYEILRKGTDVVVAKIDYIKSDYSGPTAISPLDPQEFRDFMNPKPEPRPEPPDLGPSRNYGDVISGPPPHPALPNPTPA